LRKINKSPNRGKNLDVHFFFQFVCLTLIAKRLRGPVHVDTCYFESEKKNPSPNICGALEVQFLSIFIPHTHFQKVGKAICGQAILKVYKTKSVTKHRKGP